jgi:glutaredoxin 3
MSSISYMINYQSIMKIKVIMGNKIASKVFIILAGILIIFAITKIYSNYNSSQNITLVKRSGENLDVLIYSKEGCIYCVQAKNLLDKKQIQYKNIELSNNRNLHLKLASQTGQNTVPYIFINNKFVGGFQNLQELENRGEL